MKPGTIMISALRGGSGKTLISIGIVSAWRESEKSVAAFKKGPDYIDAGWLAVAAGRPCYNLDTFLISPPKIEHSFHSRSKNIDFALIEGNRGLYDGFELEGTTSTAELSKLIDAPVVLCLDCTKSTRTMAAIVLGCLRFDPGVRIEGVVLNRVAGSRHETILTKSIEHHCGVSVVGALPKLDEQYFPERHMGLVPAPEHRWAVETVDKMAGLATKYLNLSAIESIASSGGKPGSAPSAAVAATESSEKPDTPITCGSSTNVRIAVLKDSAFQFYYPENIEALAEQGAEIEYVSPISDKTLPPVDALYIGGGFPETHARELMENRGFKERIKSCAEEGMPVYAECGGLMYLGKELVLNGVAYPMTGVFNLAFGFSKRPKGHGYTISRVIRENPYFKQGGEIRGHEFHYSSVLSWTGREAKFAFLMDRGTGIAEGKDGLLYKNVFATYVHIHALGSPEWALSLVREAKRFKTKKRLSSH